MMHAMNWLQKHREYLSGTLSKSQLLRHGRLGRNFPRPEPGCLELLTPEMFELSRSVQGFYARLLMLDQRWHGHDPNSPNPVANMLEGLGAVFRD